MLSNNSAFLRSSQPQYYLVLPQTLESGVFLCLLTDEETEMVTGKQRLHPSGKSVWDFTTDQSAVIIGSTTYWLLVKCDPCLDEMG